MSSTDVQTPELTDPELISRVRDGDVAAYGTLFSRHVDAATRLARLTTGGSDADDLVSEAFMKVLNVLLGGGGPDVAFRAYLLTAVRRLHIDKVRTNQRLTTTDDLSPFDPGVPFTDTAVAGFEGGAAAKAFASLPERWQMVLWHLEVENQKPAEIAPLLGMTPNSVSALAYRAREGLRQAFLNMHSGDLVSETCRETNELLGGYVRGALSRRDATRVGDHLEHCRRCTAVYLELSEVNSSLAALLGPALLGSAAAAYLGGGGAAATGLGAAFVALIGRGKDVALGHASASATAATGGVAGVVGVTAITVVDRGPDEASTSARPPASGSAPPSQTGRSLDPADAKDPGKSRTPADADRAPRSATPPGTAAPAVEELEMTAEEESAASGLEPSGDQAGFEAGVRSPADGTGSGGSGVATDPSPGPQPKPAAPEPNAPGPTKPAPPKPTKPPRDGDDSDGGIGHGRGHGKGHDKGHGKGRGQGLVHGVGHVLEHVLGEGPHDGDRRDRDGRR